MTEHPTRRWTVAEKFVGACALVVALGVVFACAGGGAKAPVPSALSGYPSSPAFDEVISTHFDAGTDARENRLLMTTWFLDGNVQGVSQWCSVRADGRCHEYPFVPEVRSMGRREPWQLPPQTMELLRKALAEMPPSEHPSVANMLIVSYRDGAGAWQTRAYDRTNRPAAVSTIFGLTGAPVVP